LNTIDKIFKDFHNPLGKTTEVTTCCSSWSNLVAIYYCEMNPAPFGEQNFNVRISFNDRESHFTGSSVFSHNSSTNHARVLTEASKNA